MHVIRLFISILSDFVTSHKIAFYSKLYDIDLFENCTHDRMYITLYVHEFLLSLHQHCFLDKKAPPCTTLRHWITFVVCIQYFCSEEPLTRLKNWILAMQM